MCRCRANGLLQAVLESWFGVFIAITFVFWSVLITSHSADGTQTRAVDRLKHADERAAQPEEPLSTRLKHPTHVPRGRAPPEWRRTQSKKY